MTIDRTLVRIERDGEWTVVEQDRIDPLFDPVVILGDPGMGKTTLLRGLCRRSGMTYVHAADLVRAGDPASLIPGDERAAVDGLDETASPGTGSAVEAVLRRLRETESPPPVLACRAAEWRDAADLARIEDAYAGKPETLYLMPFDDAEARDFLAREFPGIQVPALLQHLRNPGLAHVCRNPLVLRMFGEAIRGASALPASRTELFERACCAMAGQDSREGVIRLVRADEDDLLLAAGAICATLLLCDLAGVHDAPGAETPPGWANVTDIAGLSLAGAAAEALATRLFRPGAGGRFTFLHRALAEYLGARWLARCMDNGLSAARILGLFEAGGGVPTALRGMHAWLARLAPILAGRCIAADPHAVLRDGETETLDLERARELLTALKERSGEDPSFDREDRGVHPAFGLMRMELKDDIVGILASPGRHAQLSACLAQAMGGTELSVEAGWTLEGILFDSARDYDERAMALLSLWVAGAHHMEAVALRLADMRDAASARLLCEAVAKEAMDAVPTSALPAATPRRPRLVTGGETVPDLGAAKADGGGVFGALDAAGLASRARRNRLRRANHGGKCGHAGEVRARGRHKESGGARSGTGSGGRRGAGLDMGWLDQRGGRRRERPRTPGGGVPQPTRASHGASRACPADAPAKRRLGGGTRSGDHRARPQSGRERLRGAAGSIARAHLGRRDRPRSAAEAPGSRPFGVIQH